MALFTGTGAVLGGGLNIFMPLRTLFALFTPLAVVDVDNVDDVDGADDEGWSSTGLRPMLEREGIRFLFCLVTDSTSFFTAM